MDPTLEQQAVINAPLVPLAVIACAGSGKTATAIHRLVAMRRQLGENRGRVALLSFSNVAVETFRQGYRAQATQLPDGVGRSRVDIDTLDSFFATHVLRPHGHRTMRATRAPYLVLGSEPFLSAFNCPAAAFPISITDVKVDFENGQPVFFYIARNGVNQALDNRANVQVNRLGTHGAYTHELGRYWCYRTLVEQPAILRALTRRYPHIVVDESQDIGSMHQAILELLIREGSQVSLIGDPNQGIYEFTGADGSLLRTYHERVGVSEFALTRNYRSLPSIQNVANHLSRRDDEADRQDEPSPKGAYFIGYRDAQIPQLIDAFRAQLQEIGASPERAVIICRSTSLVRKVSGADEPVGSGVVKDFAEAALLRDMSHRHLDAFKAVARGIIPLLRNPAQGLLAKLCHPAHDPEIRELRRRLWSFTRDAQTGLPSSDLAAKGEWHRLLLQNVGQLLDGIQQDINLLPVDTLSQRITRRDLPDRPLNAGFDLAAQQGPNIRIDSVHQVKGESIDAVLYVGSKPHIRGLLDGVQSEVGRIGYVAVTRAKDLLWLAVPAASMTEFREELTAAGFVEVGRA